MTEKILFEDGNPTSKIRENLDDLFWTPCMFLTYVKCSKGIIYFIKSQLRYKLSNITVIFHGNDD